MNECEPGGSIWVAGARYILVRLPSSCFSPAVLFWRADSLLPFTIFKAAYMLLRLRASFLYLGISYQCMRLPWGI